MGAGHWWPWISAAFESIAVKKQGNDSQWPPLNLSAFHILIQYIPFLLGMSRLTKIQFTDPMNRASLTDISVFLILVIQDC